MGQTTKYVPKNNIKNNNRTPADVQMRHMFTK